MFVFYDTETTGLDHDFSQILQIALVFTDDNLNILSSKKLDCRASPWVVPSPGALLTTGFTPADLKLNKLSNYEMMQEVDSWIRKQHWPVTFVGYNSINYDEPVLAQNFYQNLLDSHLTSAKSGTSNQYNGRADIMLMVKAALVYAPEVLKLDTLNYFGQPSLTLKTVAEQNGVVLSAEDAHDAMNDIKATIGVAKAIRKAAPQLWDQILSLSTSEGVNAFLASHETFTYVNTDNYKEKLKASVMTSLTETAAGTQMLYDLSIDPAPYFKMSAEELKNVFLAVSGLQPFVPVRKDNQPILMPMELSGTAVKDDALYTARARAIQAHPDFLQKVVEASALAQQVRAAVPDTMPERMIDKPVPAAVQARLQQWCDAFHKAQDWHESAALIDDFYVRFKADLATDPSLSRFVKLAGRIVYEHAPQELSAEKQEAMKKHIASRLLTPDLNAPYMTIARARKELSDIEYQRAQKGGKKWADVTDSQIRSLKLYYTALEREYAAYYVPAVVVPPAAPRKTGPKP